MDPPADCQLPPLCDPMLNMFDHTVVELDLHTSPGGVIPFGFTVNLEKEPLHKVFGFRVIPQDSSGDLKYQPAPCRSNRMPSACALPRRISLFSSSSLG